MDRIELKLSRIGLGLGQDWVRFEPGFGQHWARIGLVFGLDGPGLSQDKTRTETEE